MYMFVDIEQNSVPGFPFLKLFFSHTKVIWD